MIFVIFSTLFFVLLGESITVDAAHGIGKCKNITQVDTAFNFKEYATKNKGAWHAVLLPNTDFYKPVKKWWLETIPTKEAGVYTTNIYYQKDDGMIRNLVKNERLESLSEGHMTATLVNEEGNKEIFKFTALKFDSGKYFYYYICGDEGADDTTDYRFLLVQEPLDSKEISKIIKYDETFGFKNTLKQI